MNILFIKNGNAHVYTNTMAQRDARMAVKGRGKLTGYMLKVNEDNNRFSLIADYEDKKGWRGQVSIAV